MKQTHKIKLFESAVVGLGDVSLSMVIVRSSGEFLQMQNVLSVTRESLVASFFRAKTRKDTFGAQMASSWQVSLHRVWILGVCNTWSLLDHGTRVV